MKKGDILFALYKDKPTDGSRKFQRNLKKYKEEVNLNNLYVKIVNYQIDKYGTTLDSRNETSNYVEEMCLKGKWCRQDRCREYRKGNKQ